MTRRTAAIAALVWVALATAVAAGVLAGGLILGVLSPVAAGLSPWTPAPRSPQLVILPSPSGRTTTDGPLSVPSPDAAAGSGAPHDPASVSAAASGDDRPAGAPSSPTIGMRAASSEEPRSRIPLRGTISGVGTWFRSPSGVSAAGPALRAALGPDWRGTVVTVTANGRSVRTPLGDWCACADRPGGPTVIDLDDDAFARLAPLPLGVIPVTVTWRIP